MLKVFKKLLEFDIFEDDQLAGVMDGIGYMEIGKGGYGLEWSSRDKPLELKPAILANGEVIGYLEDYGGPNAPSIVAHAECPRSSNELIVVPYAGKTYELRRRRRFSRARVIWEGDVVVGFIKVNSFWRPKITADLPQEIPLPVKIFMCFASLPWQIRR